VAVEIIRQQNDNRFLIAVGEEGGVQMGRIYDIVGDTYGEPIAVGSITAHSLGWGPVVATQAIIEFVQVRVAAHRFD
jgi:hypothetical protein